MGLRVLLLEALLQDVLVQAFLGAGGVGHDVVQDSADQQAPDHGVDAENLEIVVSEDVEGDAADGGSHGAGPR